MFDHLEIETIGGCTRKCGWCMRNTEPDRDAVASYFSGAKLPVSDIMRVVDESMRFGFFGTVCLSHYNEPLLDERLPEIAAEIKRLGLRTMACSNADLLNADLAGKLDGGFDVLRLSFYGPQPDSRIAEVCSWFSVCALDVHREEHILPTHHSRVFQLDGYVQQFRDLPCYEPDRRFIVNHQGKILLCCEDLIGRFGLGSIYDGLTIGELYHSAERLRYVRALAEAGGRSIHPHCAGCPRPT